MTKIIEPSEEFAQAFKEFCIEKYQGSEFSMAEAANSFFQKRYNTTDKWTDPKNITGYVKRMSETGDTFEFTEVRKSEATGHMSKHYKIKEIRYSPLELFLLEFGKEVFSLTTENFNGEYIGEHYVVRTFEGSYRENVQVYAKKFNDRFVLTDTQKLELRENEEGLEK